MSERDETLGLALRALPVPDHRLSFRMPRARTPLLPVAGVGAVALAVAVAAVVLPLSRTGHASAADVREKVAQAVAETHSLSGTFVNYLGDSVGPGGSDFVLAADGSFRLRTHGFEKAYDAEANVVTEYPYRRPPERRTFLRVTSGVDPAVRAFGLIGDEYIVAVKALLAGTGDYVRETTFAGRAAWRIDVRFTPRDALFFAYGRRLVAVVDKETGFVVRTESYLGSGQRPTHVSELRNLRVDIETRRSMFRVDVPAGTPESRVDRGFRIVSPASAEAVVGYRPLLPGRPAGLELGTLGVAKAATFGRGTVRRDVTAAMFRLGTFGGAEITTSRYPAGAPVPPAEDRPAAISLRRVSLTGGELAGKVAYLDAPPLGYTRVWVRDGDLLVSVASSLTEEQTLEAVNSLQR